MRKECIECNENKSLNEFRKSKYTRDKYDTKCKKCRIKYEKEYREKNRSKMKEIQSKYKNKIREADASNHYKSWTIKEIDWLRNNKDKHSRTYLAMKLNRTIRSIGSKVYEINKEDKECLEQVEH